MCNWENKAEEGDGQQSNFIFENDKNIWGRQKYLKEINHFKNGKTSQEQKRCQDYKTTEIFVDKVESIFLEKRLIIEMGEASVY